MAAEAVKKLINGFSCYILVIKEKAKPKMENEK